MITTNQHHQYYRHCYWNYCNCLHSRHLRNLNQNKDHIRIRFAVKTHRLKIATANKNNLDKVNGHKCFGKNIHLHNQI